MVASILMFTNVEIRTERVPTATAELSPESRQHHDHDHEHKHDSSFCSLPRPRCITSSL